jgi:hypothetical protein
MVNVLSEPRLPAEGWQQKLDGWLGEIRQVFDQAKSWAEKREWATKEDEKRLTEDELGTYEVPVLLIHTPQGRLLLDPIARNVFDAEGRIDFCVMPSYDSVILVKNKGIWSFHSTVRNDLRQPWSEESFDHVARELLKMQ